MLKKKSPMKKLELQKETLRKAKGGWWHRTTNRCNQYTPQSNATCNGWTGWGYSVCGGCSFTCTCNYCQTNETICCTPEPCYS